MNNGHILRSKHLIDSLFLHRIKPREAYGLKREVLGGLTGIEEVAQVGQSVTLGTHHTVQSIKHYAIASLVK